MRKSSEEAGKKPRKTGKDRGGRRPPRPPSRRNRKGTSRIRKGPGRKISKAGKGPLQHHEENREGPGQKKREAQRASRAMRKHGGAVRKQGRSWKTGKERGGRRPPRPPNRREQERNQQDRGWAREERRWTMEA